ncbi:MAG: thermosome subunit [Halobacteriales archaeon]|nr:thermosome subunit [Halobacteriales archaeon]
MSNQLRGRPMIILGEGAQRVRDRDAQSYNIRAARAVANAVRSTLGPKGMDKMLVDNMGDVTITNDGVTILKEMNIEHPTAEMVVEVAQTQEDEAGDGTTTAVALTGELLKNAEELLEQDIHATAIIRGYNLANEKVKEELEVVSNTIDVEDLSLLQKVAETSMTGKGTEVHKEMLAKMVVEAVKKVSYEDEGEICVDLDFLNIETQSGESTLESELFNGAVIDKEATHDNMPSEMKDANILLLMEAIEIKETEVDAKINITDATQLRHVLDQEEEEIRNQVQKIIDSGANVIFCQKAIDEVARHYLAKAGILAVRRMKKSDMHFLKHLLDTTIVSDIDDLSSDDLSKGKVSRDDDDKLFYVESANQDGFGVTLLLRGSTEHVVDELERSVGDAIDVVSQTVTDGQVLAGGGAVEIELASRLRSYAESVSGREQLAIEAFANSLELIPRVLAENAGLDPIDVLVDLRASHEEGNQKAGLNVFTGDVVNTFDAGVIEPTHAKRQAVSSATEASNLILKIDDIIAAGDLGKSGGDMGEMMPGMM